MNIIDFFKHYVEGYIFGDLEAIASLGGRKYGGAGFPMILTSLSGMELLGNLLFPSEDEFDEMKGRDYFLNYWDNYFSETYPKYKGLGPLFYKLMRHGIAHNFLTKPGVYISKNSSWQTEIKLDTKEILIDCIVFYREFKFSYESKVISILNDDLPVKIPNIHTVEKRIKSMQKAYIKSRDNSFKLYEEYLKNNPTSNNAELLTTNKIDKINVSTTYYSNAKDITDTGVSGYTADVSGTSPFIVN